MKYLQLFIFLNIVAVYTASGQEATKKVVEYQLTIDEQVQKIKGKETKGMSVNGGVPGPTLRFTEGDSAVIYVKNNMDVETSVHWHGLLLPNFYDGVPYLTTPPIKPGETQMYTFPLKQSGTYWYHSHTMLQEQSGVYGSIVIEPKQKTLDYDTDLVLVLSDWTNEKPEHVLKNLKRGLEWYNIKKGTATPLNRVIARGGLGAQINFWRQRMEGADIADIYYPAFLVNGKPTQSYPDFKPGEKVRLRFVNAAASSQFWITFGGPDPMLVSADGKDVVPVKRNKTFIGIAETYDFIVTIPEDGKIEVRATAQDGSGKSSAYLGKGQLMASPDVPRPDKIGMMKQMAKMEMRMGAPAMKFKPKNPEPQKMMDNWGMHMNHGDMDNMKNRKPAKDSMQHMDHSMHGGNGNMKNNADTASQSNMVNKHQMHKKDSAGMDMSHMDMSNKEMNDMQKPDKDMSDMDMSDMDMSGMGMSGMEMPGMDMYSEYNYDYLKSPEKTAYPEDAPVNEILLNLTGNMWRYIWSMNGVPLNESDQIKIKKGEVTRIVLNNLTMMHHPMHLHGHFFRVINKNGEYSPLKHTVNVPPMQKVVIEFFGNEYGDWFFHCHVLYHMNSGMARIFSYDTPRDKRLLGFPVVNLVNEANQFFTWGTADVTSHMAEFTLTSSNIRNQFNVRAEFGWNKNLEGEVSYERYLSDYFRVFAGINIENENRKELDKLETTAVVGIRYFTPYMFNLDVRVDNLLRPEIRLNREVMIFSRTLLFGNFEYQADFGWMNNQSETENQIVNPNFKDEITWSAGLEYMLSRNFSLTGSYDNRFGAGGGLSVRF